MEANSGQPESGPLSLADFLRQEIRRAAEDFNELWPGFDVDPKVETPHRQRVCVNRLHGYALFLGIKRGDRSEGARGLKALRKWRRKLGPLRDLDVMRGWLAKCGKASPEDAAPAVDELDRELLELRVSLVRSVRRSAKGIHGAKARVAMAQVVGFLEKRIDKLERSGGELIWEKALRQVAEPWESERKRLYDDQGEKALHNFRLANKELRFVLDTLSGVIPGEEGKLVKRRARVCSKAHSVLGSLNDLWILRDRLRLARARWALEEKRLDNAAQLLESGRARLELQQHERWIALWPKLAAPGFARKIASR